MGAGLEGPANAPVLRWQDGVPIVRRIGAWDGEGMLDLSVPDGAAPRSPSASASGSWDGLATHQLGTGAGRRSNDIVGSVLFCLERLIRTRSDHARAALYDLFIDDPIVGYADVLLERLVRQRRIAPDAARPWARWLVEVAAHPEPLKLGLVMLGAFGDGHDLETLETVARHDEFTLYAVVAAGHIVEDPTDLWLSMARRVRGWGRVHVVERLTDRLLRNEAVRPDVQAWLLREGCHSAMPEYVALGCAQAGDLAGALAPGPGREPDPALLDGACTLVDALLREGTAEDIEGYTEGAAAVRALVHHLDARGDTVSHLAVVCRIHDWLEWPDRLLPLDSLETRVAHALSDEPVGERAVWARRAALGWTPDVRARLTSRCEAILERPIWAERVRAAYRNGDDAARRQAWAVAPAVGLDLWEDAFARLQKHPDEPSLYRALAGTADRVRLERLIGLAERTLPLETLATGAAGSVGTGARLRGHAALYFLLSALRAADIGSDALLAAALRSPVYRNRAAAVSLLERGQRWGAPVADALAAAEVEEPREDLRARVIILRAPGS